MGIVHLIDDDAALRRALVRLLAAAGHQVHDHASAADYLQHEPGEGPGCLLLDLQMPGIDGLELQAALARHPAHRRPIIFLSGTADVRASVCAMQAGAREFLTKPVDAELLLGAVDEAIAADAGAREHAARAGATQRRIESLGARQRRVLEGIVAGRLYKQLAAEFGVSERTIKVDRATVMQRLGVRTLPALLKMLMEADRLRPARPQS
jgi:FixJ family two-component response regulator